MKMPFLKSEIPELRGLLSSQTNLSFIQVGALDGYSFDPIYELIAENPGWHGLVIEPIPSAFEVLCQTYKGRDNIKPLNIAIDPDSPSIKLHYIPPNNDLPDWVRGLSSAYLDRNNLSGSGLTPALRNQIRSSIKTHTAPATTLTALVKAHQLHTLDWLQIDTEGHDWKVLKSLDLNLCKPRYIHIEYYNLPIPEKVQLISYLFVKKYKIIRDHKDILAMAI